MRSTEDLRADTPGVASVAHFNNCGSALPPAVVVDAQIEHLQLERDVGGYEAAARNQTKRTVHSAAARLLGCGADEIAFADSASRAWNVFLYLLALRPGDEILTSRIEFGFNVVSLRQLAARTDATLKVVGSRPDGTIDLDDLGRSLSGRTRLVAVTHAAGHFGGVNPVEKVGALVADTGALFLVDACQSLGQMPVDVDPMSCHALTGTGRKWLRGPRGTGFLYVRGDLGEIGQRVDPVVPAQVVAAGLGRAGDSTVTGVDKGCGGRRFELWERNVAAEIGLAVALEYLLEVGVEAAHQRITSLATRVLEGLQPITGISLLPTDEVRSGIVGLTLPGGPRAVAAIKGYLHERGVNVSSMSYCDAPLDYAARRIEAALRIAPHYYNTEDEVDELCAHLAAGLKTV